MAAEASERIADYASALSGRSGTRTHEYDQYSPLR